jgi:hypothetical protein
VKRVRRGWLLVFVLACGGTTADEDGGIDGATSNSATDATVDVASTSDATNDVTVTFDATLDAAFDAVDAPMDAGADAIADAKPDGDADADADAGVGFDASACVDYDAKVCSTLTPSPIVSVGCANVAPAAGGIIVDGYYLLTSAVFNTAKNDGGCLAKNDTRRDTIEICGNFMLFLDVDTQNSSYSAGLTFTTNGATLSTTHACGGSGGDFPYTATSTTLTIYLDYSSTSELVLTLTKQ